MHFHRDRDEVGPVQAELLDDFDSSEAALAASISHGVDLNWFRGGGEGEAKILMVFTQYSHSELDEWLRPGLLLDPCIRQVAVEVMLKRDGSSLAVAGGGDSAE